MVTPNYQDYDPMYSAILYTNDEIKKLVYIYGVSSIYFETLWDGLLNVMEEGMLAGVYSKQASETETNHHLSTLEHDHYEQYKAMYLDRLEDVPLLINDGTLGIIARWRLEINK